MILLEKENTMETRFKTKLKSFGNNTGILVPEEYLTELKAGKNPPVKVNVNGYVYQSTIASMSGFYLIPLSKEHREKSGLKGNDEVEVILILESKNRDVEIPEDLRYHLIDQKLMDLFLSLSYSTRKEMVRMIVEAKKEETRLNRMNQVILQLRGLNHES